MKAKSRRYKAAAVVLSGGMLLGNVSCVPDNYWVDLAGALISSAADTVMVDVIDDMLNPPATASEE